MLTGQSKSKGGALCNAANHGVLLLPGTDTASEKQNSAIREETKMKFKQVGCFIPAKSWTPEQEHNWKDHFEAQGYAVLPRAFGWILCKEV